MTIRLRSFGFFKVLLVLVAVAAVGCRTYGAYNAKEETLEAIQEANEAFEQDFQMAQRNVEELEAAGGDSSFTPDFLEQFQAVLLAHETLLQEHKELAADLSTGDHTYRTVNRAFGGILAEQEMIRLRYEDLLNAGMPVGDLRLLGVWDQLPEARYAIAPPFYDRQIEIARVMSLPEGMGSGRSGDTLINIAPNPGTPGASETATPDTATSR